MITHAIVIPCFNEALRLKISIFKAFVLSHPEVMLCFVNDGSTDNTSQKLHLLQDPFPSQICIIETKHNGGKSEAVRIGVNEILKRKEISYLGFLDADLSTSLHEYFEMLVSIKKTANLLIYASRKGNETGEISNTFFRNSLGKIASVVIKKIVKLPISDTQCGAKIFSREAATICFKNEFQTRWLFDVELFIRLIQAKSKECVLKNSKEYPLKHWNHDPNSKLKAIDILLGPILLLKIIIHYKINPFL